MSRIRTIKPEWLDDEKLGGCSDAARVLSIGLILMADDHGNGRASTTLIRNRIWGYANSSRDPRESLAELSRAGFIRLYTVNSETYYTIRNWGRHQRVDKIGKPHVPLPDVAGAAYISGSCLISSRESRESVGESRDGLAPDLYLRPVPPTCTSDLIAIAGFSGDPSPQSDSRNRTREVERITGEVVGAFNRAFGRKLGAKGYRGAVGRLLGKGYSEDELKAVVWWAADEWADDEAWRKRVDPSTLLKLVSAQGNRTFPQYLELAGERWREINPAEPLPWERQGGLDGAAA